MNAVVPHATPAASGALVPRNMADAMALAEMMAKAGFLARELQNPGGALFVIEQSMRWNMSPFSVAMETSFIQGKPMFSGKVVAAAVTSSGAIAGRLSYDYTGTGDERTVTVSGTLRGEAAPRSVAVKVKDARTANKVWITQTDQQLAYHGSRVWARRYTPEVMLGVYAPEEFEAEAEPRDVPNLAAEPPPLEPNRHPMNNPATMQSQGLALLDDQLAQFVEKEEILAYLAQPKVQRLNDKATAAGKADQWSGIVQAHLARVSPDDREYDASDREPGEEG